MARPKAFEDEEVIEGTGAEIAEHLRSSKLAGRWFRLVPLPKPDTSEEGAPLSLEEEERLLDQLAAAGEHLPILPPEANSREWLYQEQD